MVPYPPESNYEVRSSSVTRFKEEIGNEKTNTTDGNFIYFYGYSITSELCNCKGFYAPIVALFYIICELWRKNRLRRIELLNQDVV